MELGSGIWTSSAQRLPGVSVALTPSNRSSNGISQAEGGGEARWDDAHCEVGGEEGAARSRREGGRGQAQREGDEEERIASRWCAQGWSEALDHEEQVMLLHETKSGGLQSESPRFVMMLPR
jgi:hypothetical protein